jgi:hypothetical protein
MWFGILFVSVRIAEYEPDCPSRSELYFRLEETNIDRQELLRLSLDNVDKLNTKSLCPLWTYLRVAFLYRHPVTVCMVGGFDATKCSTMRRRSYEIDLAQIAVGSRSRFIRSLGYGWSNCCAADLRSTSIHSSPFNSVPSRMQLWRDLKLIARFGRSAN